MRFIVYAPGPYDERGGGCIALHKLANNIAECGQDSYIMADTKNPAYKGTLINEAMAKQLAMDSKTMVIYPEVVTGNPLSAAHVTRWILYHVRQYGEYGIYGENDLIYKYAPHFTTRLGNEVSGELRAVELNLGLFFDYGKYRELETCHLFKKAGANKKPIHYESSLCLDDYPEKGGLKYLANAFNYHKTFIAYDGATWLSVMSALCGCVSVVVPDAGVTPEQFYNGFPYFKYGIAYGNTEKELKHAADTLHLVRENLEAIEAETMGQCRAFIDNCKLKMWL